MEKIILEEVIKIKNLMGLKINEDTSFNKNLLNEARIKLNIDAGNLNLKTPKGFDTFIKDTGIRGINFEKFKTLSDIEIMSNADVIRSLTGLKDLWIYRFNQKFPGNGEKLYDTTLEYFKVFDQVDENGKVLIPDLTQKTDTGKFIWELIPEEGGMRSALLWEIYRRNPKYFNDVLLPTVGKNSKKLSAELAGQETPEVTAKRLLPGKKWNDIKNEFGSSGSAGDNKKLQDAILADWKPGKDVPKKYQTETYKAKLNGETVTPTPDTSTPDTSTPDTSTPDSGSDFGDALLSAKQRIRQSNTRENPLDVEKLVDEFGIEPGNMDDVNKLNDALNAQWKGGFVPERFQTETYRNPIQRLRNKVNSTIGYQGRGDEAIEEFGVNPAVKGDIDKFNTAWDEPTNWRPGETVPQEYRTQIYEERLKVTTKETIERLREDLDKNPTKQGRWNAFWNYLKNGLPRKIWYQSLSNIENMFGVGSKNFNELRDSFVKKVLQYQSTAKNSKLTESMLREEFLKISRDVSNRQLEAVFTQISESFYDAGRTDLEKAEITKIFGNLLGGENQEDGLKFIFDKLNDNNLDQSNMKDFWFGQRKMVNGKLEYVLPEEFYKQVLTVLYKGIVLKIKNLVLSGSFFSPSEVRLFNTKNQYKTSNAWKTFLYRKAFTKLLVPISWELYCWDESRSLAREEASGGGEQGSFKESSWWEPIKEGIKKGLHLNIKEKPIWETILAIPPGEVDRIVSGIRKRIEKNEQNTQEIVTTWEIKVISKSALGKKIESVKKYDNFDDAQKGYNEWCVGNTLKSKLVENCVVTNPEDGPFIDTSKGKNDQDQNQDTTSEFTDSANYLYELYKSGQYIFEWKIVDNISDTDLDTFIKTIQKGKTSNGKTYNENIFYREFPKKSGTFYLYYFDDNKNLYERKTTTDELKNTPLVDMANNKSGFKKMVRVKNESIISKTIKNMLREEKSRTKFGEDNFKHWKETFQFKAEDEKNPGQYKNVKINMEDVMDRINHYRKKYDEDDAFVRAVVDTHENIVKFMFTKDLAHIRESVKPVGLALILSRITESRGEMEIWSVARPANGNWFLVKGDFNKNQLSNMDLKKVEPKDKVTTKNEKSEEGLKKKEETAISKLRQDEKDGIEHLPRQVKMKIREKLRNGWTTEEPYEFLSDFYTESEINSIFNDKIKIYKLKATKGFFEALKENSPNVFITKGFCKTLNSIKNDSDITDNTRPVVKHLISKCENKFGGDYGFIQNNGSLSHH